MATCSLLKRRQPEDITRMLLLRETAGVTYNSLAQVPSDLLDDLDEREDLQGIPTLLADLDRFSVTVGTCCHSPFVKHTVLEEDEDDTLFELLKTLLSNLSNFETRRSHEEATAEEEQNKYAKIFSEYDGIRILVRILMYSSTLQVTAWSRKDCQKDLRVKSVCMEVITKIVSTDIGEQIADEMSENEDLLVYLFTLLSHDVTTITACRLLEDLLQSRKCTLNLTKIPNLRNLIACFDDAKLANFCRILAVTISDLDVYENKSSLFAQNKQKRTTGFINIRDVNQDLLLGMQDLLPRLVNIVVNLYSAYTPRYRNKHSELDCWMEWIDNTLADAIDQPEVDDFAEFIGGISEAATANGPMMQQPGVRICFDLINRVEVVYVLGLFLVGKHRKKVQRKLAELKLIPALSNFFDQFIWKCQMHRNNSRHRLRGHNASCECSPEVALKIQFLRLVHSFCDHSDYKHLLLSRSELSELKRINEKAATPLVVGDLENINTQLMCKGSKGLLTKIVEVLKKEPNASTFRFWLARAVESYLRGRTSYCDQIFLLRRGLLQHVASNIVEYDIRPKEILQSSFDLLGELVKFNCESFKAFDKVLSTKQKVDKFILTVNRNLVDSNMFLRSLILSLEHFTTVQPEFAEYATKECHLLKYLDEFGKQVDYLHRLVNIINVQTLTQENVSCLNTTLVFLMFANRRGELPKYLAALREEKFCRPHEKKGGDVLMKNFRDLLLFWQEHYLHKDKDCSALEKSSRISFDYWKKTVTMLVDDDRNQHTSVLHYIPPDKCRDN